MKYLRRAKNVLAISVKTPLKRAETSGAVQTLLFFLVFGFICSMTFQLPIQGKKKVS